jgi:glycosyltransferase involved in cell wall biosynthesis
MQIAFLTPALDYSGAPKMMAWVANQMHRQGHSTKIYLLYSDKVMQPLDEGVEFECLNLSRSKNRILRNTVDLAKSVHKLHKMMKKEKPDIIVTFLDTVGYMYMLKNKFSKRFKVVASERSDPYAYKGLAGKIRHKLIGLADRVVFQTEGAKEFYSHNKKMIAKSVVIPNPIIPKNASYGLKKVSYEERDNRIVSVGRLDLKQKRYDVMIDAFKIAHKSFPELQLHIYGDGADKQKIQDIIDLNKLNDCVFLRGRTDNVEMEIQKARAFVLTSDYEGIPNALIEAMLAGVPSVATDCSPGGAALLIKNGENGLLVPREDAPAVADAIIKLALDENLSNEISSNSPMLAERFSESEISKLWISCFESLSNKK